MNFSFVVWVPKNYLPMMVFFPRTTSCVSLKSAVLRQTKGNCGKVPTVMLIFSSSSSSREDGVSKQIGCASLNFICEKL
jgi:hypothetical protein